MHLIQAVVIFGAAGFLMAFGILLVGRLFRPQRTNPDKASAYECGETPIGSGRVQFDLRFYAVALVFLVFDVELALFYPWAVLYGGAEGAADKATLPQIRWAALWDMLFFLAVIAVGFVYLWRFGYLDWVRSAAAQPEQPQQRLLMRVPPPVEPYLERHPAPAAPSGGS
jgi:NADH-quinone oxidoreductase subunit A